MFHRTQRLLLRPIWAEDWQDILSGISDEGVVRNLARAPWPYSAQDARDFAGRAHDARLPSFLAILPSPNGQMVVGCAGLALDGDNVELGYWIARQYWGRGFATEAARGVMEIARLIGHRQLIAGHFTDNPASGRVLRKLGFQPTGQVIERHSCGRDEMADMVEYKCDLAVQSDPVERKLHAA